MSFLYGKLAGLFKAKPTRTAPTEGGLTGKDIINAIPSEKPPDEIADQAQIRDLTPARDQATQHLTKPPQDSTPSHIVSQARSALEGHESSRFASLLSDRHQQLVHQRDKTVQLRVQTDYERQKFAETIRLYQDTQTSLLAAFSERLKHPDQETVVNADLQPLHATLKRHVEAITTYLDSTRASERLLARAEERSASLENELLGLLTMELDDSVRNGHGTVMDAVIDTEAMNQRTAGSSPRSLDFPPLPPALEEYYDKLGDIGLLGEQLANLEGEYQEARQNRDFKYDHEQALSMTESDFDLTYRQPLVDTGHEIEEAIRAVQRLKKLCLDQGIEIPNDGPPLSETTDELLLGREMDLEQHQTPPRSGSFATRKDLIKELYPQSESALSQMLGSVKKLRPVIVSELDLASSSIPRYDTEMDDRIGAWVTDAAGQASAPAVQVDNEADLSRESTISQHLGDSSKPTGHQSLSRVQKASSMVDLTRASRQVDGGLPARPQSAQLPSLTTTSSDVRGLDRWCPAFSATPGVPSLDTT